MAGLGEWPLVVAVLSGLIAASSVMIGVLTLGQRIVADLVERVDKSRDDILRQVDLRFAEAEARRVQASETWMDRLRESNDARDRLAQRVEQIVARLH